MPEREGTRYIPELESQNLLKDSSGEMEFPAKKLPYVAPNIVPMEPTISRVEPSNIRPETHMPSTDVLPNPGKIRKRTFTTQEERVKFTEDLVQKLRERFSFNDYELRMLLGNSLLPYHEIGMKRLSRGERYHLRDQVKPQDKLLLTILEQDAELFNSMIDSYPTNIRTDMRNKGVPIPRIRVRPPVTPSTAPAEILDQDEYLPPPRPRESQTVPVFKVVEPARVNLRHEVYEMRTGEVFDRQYTWGEIAKELSITEAKARVLFIAERNRRQKPHD